jgi:2-methylisocitrate lyase-like PEP mutase family enzyme
MEAATSMTKAAHMRRRRLRDSRPLVSPEIFDRHSAPIVETTGFKYAAMSGSQQLEQKYGSDGRDYVVRQH